MNLSDNPSSPPPLSGDPDREADATLRAFDYQVWCSLLAWLTLRQEQVLYLEIAEDYQVADSVSVTAVQVSAAAAPITLRSPKVIECMSNFWTYQSTETRSVELHLLTTSRIGVEEGKPLGPDGGLRAWERCRAAGADLKPLRDFLIALEPLPGTLKEFLASGSDEEIRARLLRRIHWTTAARDFTGIEQEVERHLVALGAELLRLTPDESRQAIAELHSHVWRTARQKNQRQLHRSDLLTELEKATTVRIPRAVADILYEMRPPIGARPQASLTDVFESFPSLLELPATSLDGLVPRGSLSEGALSKLHDLNLVMLHGAAGMGKSFLARRVAQASPGLWKELSLGHRTDTEAAARVDAATARLHKSAEPMNILVDDIDFTRPRLLSAFRILFRAAQARGALLAATGHHPLPFSLASELSLDDASIPVPPLQLSELQELVALHGCPADRVNAWAVFTLATTAGHVLLSHARVLRLKRDGWPPTELMRFDPPELAQVQKEARDRLRAELPETLREFVYRLTVFTHGFRRDQALAVAEHPTPGDLFEQLLGPWIERTSNDRFRVNPLIGAASDIFQAETLSRLHHRAAQAVLGAGHPTYVELSALLMHGLLGEHDSALTHAFVGVYNTLDTPQEQEVLDAFWLPSSWFIPCRVVPGEQLYPSNPALSVMLRQVQFRAAIDTNNQDFAGLIVDAWEKELDERCGQPDEPSQRLVFLTMILGSRFTMPTSTRLARLYRAVELYRSGREGSSRAAAEGPPSIGAFLSSLLSMAICHVATPEDLDALLNGMSCLREPDAIRETLNEPWVSQVVIHLSAREKYTAKQRSFLERVRAVAGSYNALSCAESIERALALVPTQEEARTSQYVRTLIERIESARSDENRGALRRELAGAWQLVRDTAAFTAGFKAETRAARFFYCGLNELDEAFPDVVRHLTQHVRTSGGDQARRSSEEFYAPVASLRDELTNELAEMLATEVPGTRVLVPNLRYARAVFGILLLGHRRTLAAFERAPFDADPLVIEAILADLEAVRSAYIGEIGEEDPRMLVIALREADTLWMGGRPEEAKAKAEECQRLAEARGIDMGEELRQHLSGAPRQAAREQVVRLLGTTNQKSG